MPQVKLPTSVRIINKNSGNQSSDDWSMDSISDHRHISSSNVSESCSSIASAASLTIKHPTGTSYPIPQRLHPRESILEMRRRHAGKTMDDIMLINAVKANYSFIYRINDGADTVNTILQRVCNERGWREFQELLPGVGNATSYERAMRSATGWNLWWSYSIYQFSPYGYLRHWQFTNHNPKGFQFCNKLYLTMYLRKMKVIHGPVFDFYPQSYIIPEDYLRLSVEHSKRATESSSLTSYHNLLNPSDVPRTTADVHANPSVIISKRMKSPVWSKHPPPVPSPHDIRFVPVWISKPIAQSQGKGIYITTHIPAIANDKKSVVQEYISRPLLLGGYKWDMRIYVCVAAIDPLVIYLYQEGLCRFCTEKYETTDLSKAYSHLTNASLNKLSPSYQMDKELIGPGCKWPLRKLRQHFKDNGIADWYLWQRIMSMVVLTVIGDSLRLGYSASNRNCFDLFGFDVMVDEELKPWLLECNYSPGLGGDCETDEIVKRPMLHELFDLLGFPDSNSYGKPTTAIRPHTMDRYGSRGNETTSVKSGSGDGDDVVLYDKNNLTRHYFELLMDKLKKTNEDMGVISDVKPSRRWSSTCNPEKRLLDAKSIYSQNLVVQYLKNQSQGKISNKVREQLITLAAKKLKSKLVASSKMAEEANKNDKRHKSQSPVRIDSSTQYDCKDYVTDLKVAAAATSRTNTAVSSSPKSKKPRPKTVPSRGRPAAASASSSNNSTVYTIPTTTLFGRLKKEFPHPDSEAFQKLKHYFDAGVDYPLDEKTGRFKECPALLTLKRDWFHPAKQQGGWIRVYPFDARTTKSPYKSSLTDIRQAVRTLESYLNTAEQLFHLHPHESDEFYNKKMKHICRRETEIWVPPSESQLWSAGFSHPVVISESNPDCSIAVDADSSCVCTDQ